MKINNFEVNRGDIDNRGIKWLYYVELLGGCMVVIYYLLDLIFI